MLIEAQGKAKGWFAGETVKVEGLDMEFRKVPRGVAGIVKQMLPELTSAESKYNFRSFARKLDTRLDEYPIKSTQDPDRDPDILRLYLHGAMGSSGVPSLKGVIDEVFLEMVGLLSARERAYLSIPIAVSFPDGAKNI